MKLPSLLSALLLAVCVFAAPNVSSAGTPAAKATPRPRHYFKITDISADSISISDDKVTKTFKITKDTEITLMGETVTADKLTVGLKAQVEPGIGDGEAGRIVATNPPPEPKPK